jgi:hypothetical protein
LVNLDKQLGKPFVFFSEQIELLLLKKLARIVALAPICKPVLVDQSERA